MDSIYILSVYEESTKTARPHTVSAYINTIYAAIGNAVMEGEMAYGGMRGKEGFLLFRQDFQNESIDADKLYNGLVAEYENENVAEYARINEHTDAYTWLNMGEDELRAAFAFGSESEEPGEEFEP